MGFRWSRWSVSSQNRWFSAVWMAFPPHSRFWRARWASNLPMGSFIAIAFAQVFAGAFAMGFGEYVSAQAEQDI